MPKQKKQRDLLHSISTFLDRYAHFFFLGLLIIGMYLRFWHIAEIRSFGWDQAKESWSVLDIIRGHLTLIGFPTGVGHLHIGPLYFYLLVPFYLFTHLDPIAAQYANIVVNLLTYVTLYLVSKNLFGAKAALFIILIYTTCSYLIDFNQTPWNVSFLPLIATLIYYAIRRIYEKDYRWVFILWALNGFAFHFHFTALFFPIISVLSLIFVSEKKKVFFYSLASTPLYLVFFVPTILYQVQQKSESNLYSGFVSSYYLGFHLRFLLHRLPDALIQFQLITVSKIPILGFIKFVFPLVLLFAAVIQKSAKDRILIYLFFPWFFVPLIGFTLYGGPITEYYFIYTVPIVLFIITYLQKIILIGKYKLVILVLLTLYWGYYVSLNTSGQWIKPTQNGFSKQKLNALRRVHIGEKISYNEGDIESYMYEIWTKDAKAFKPKMPWD